MLNKHRRALVAVEHISAQLIHASNKNATRITSKLKALVCVAAEISNRLSFFFVFWFEAENHIDEDASQIPA